MSVSTVEAKILLILQIALTALSVIPPTALEGEIGLALLKIVQTALGAYQTATGQPLDLTKIPLEAKV